MIVLGVDPGSLATGYGVIDTVPRLRAVSTGIIRTEAKATLPEKLEFIHRGILAVLDEFQPREMAVESLFNARNARSSLILGHARGVILLAGALRGIMVAEYAPREIKQALTGNGAAEKEQVRFMVTRCLGLLRQPPTLDQSDALAVAVCHASRSSWAGLKGAAGGSVS